ncbi:hypothetical protein BC829DRAFT_401118 [Chytridium lagenaria]|nr:hypothetical protein BC829DRAFT_401118 [Chytridium lagenaria]
MLYSGISLSLFIIVALLVESITFNVSLLHFFEPVKTYQRLVWLKHYNKSGPRDGTVLPIEAGVSAISMSVAKRSEALQSRPPTVKSRQVN